MSANKNVVLRTANERVIVLDINEDVLSKKTDNGYVFDEVMEELNTFIDCTIAEAGTRLHLINDVVNNQCVRKFIISLDTDLNIADYRELISVINRLCTK